MALVNFYREPPSANQIVSDLSNDECIVNHMPTGARELFKEAAELANLDIEMHHENTEQPWSGSVYFVIVSDGFEFLSFRTKFRTSATTWVRAGYPNQVNISELIQLPAIDQAQFVTNLSQNI